MSAKPGDFLIGVFDFFAVLVPGAVAASFLSAVAREYVSDHPSAFGRVPEEFWGDTRGWVAFAVGSYLLGQFIYVIGSSLDELYDLYRRFFNADFWEGRARLTKNFFVRLFRDGWVGNQRLFERADAIKREEVKDSDGEVVRTFQWAKVRVLISHPAVAAEINRLEADQKLFRGLIVVLLFVCVLLYFRGGVGGAAEWLTYAALLALSFWRYIDQRRKGQNLAYTYLIAMKACPPKAAAAAAES